MVKICDSGIKKPEEETNVCKAIKKGGQVNQRFCYFILSYDDDDDSEHLFLFQLKQLDLSARKEH